MYAWFACPLPSRRAVRRTPGRFPSPGMATLAWLLLAPASAPAQVSPDYLQAGALIRYEFVPPDGGRGVRQSTRVVSFGPAAGLVVRPDDSDAPVTVPVEALRRLEVSMGRSGTRLPYVLLLGTGGCVALVAALTASDEFETSDDQAAVGCGIGFAGGLAAGLFLGSITLPRTWREVDLEAMRGDGGVAVGMRLPGP